MRKPLLMLAATALFFTTKAQTIIFEDNFDSYEAGVGVAEQSLVWDTWTGSPNFDALVTADTSFSGANSAVIDGTSNDLVLPIGYDAIGSFDITFKMLLTESGGYFNLLHQWSPTSSDYFWAIDVFFSGEGAVTWRTDGTNVGDYTVNIGEWFDVKVTADMNEDLGYLYINDSLLHSWQWSLNNDGSQGENALSAVNFYGTNADNGDGLYYIEDVRVVETSGLSTGEFDNQTINLWPNPANDQLTIQLPLLKQAGNLSIFDAQGRLMENTILTNPLQSVNIAHLPAGIYAVRVVCNDKLFSHQLIVK